MKINKLSLLAWLNNEINLNKFPFLILFLFLIASCSENKKPESEASNSKYAEFINSYTAGIISSSDVVMVQLVNTYADSLQNKSLPSSILKISPAVEGRIYWANNKTLVFSPETKLPNGRSFDAQLNLSVLYPDIQKDLEIFDFSFSTITQNFDVKIDGLQIYDESDLSRLKLEGSIETADVVEFNSVTKMISAKQGNDQLKISWENSSGNSSFRFAIENVVRKEARGIVELDIIGKPIEVDRVEKMEIEVPSLTDYKVISARLINETNKYVSVKFSDPIDDKQDFNGLIRFNKSSSNPRIVVNLNELRLYPASRLSGKVELSINRGIKSVVGANLEEDYTTEIQFTQIKPEVVFTDESNKAIIPSTDGLILPFKAAGLKAVDVMVVQIFTDNILQYLQVNEVGEKSEIQRVGKPVYRKTIPLQSSGVTDLYAWNEYTLDLSEIILKDPGAVYQVKIGFQQRHSLYSCADYEVNESGNMLEESYGPEDEESYWDSYNSYNYNWRDRDNPCTSSYYGRHRMIDKVLFSSDLGIIAKKGAKNNINLYVTDIVSAASIPGVKLTVYDYQQQIVGQGNTDAQGAAVIELSEIPFVIQATKGNQSGYLRVNDASSLSLSNFDISGTKVTNGIKGFIYGDRGVWRPADTVHLSFVLEDKSMDIPGSHPVKMELFNPQSQLIHRKVSASPTGNIYRFDFVTDKDAPTGNWRVTAKVGGAAFSKTVKIETVKPNRLKINLDLDKEVITSSSSSLTGELNVNWLTGITGKNLKVEYDIQYAPMSTKFKDYGIYNFDDRSRTFYDTRTSVFEGLTDANGKANLNIQLKKNLNSPGALKAKLYGRVYEDGGDFSISQVSVPYYPYTSYVGIKTPEGDKRGMLLTDKDHSIEIATVNAEGEPVSRNDLEVNVYKLNWKWWWDKSYDDISNYVGRSYRSPITTGRATTTNGNGRWTFNISYPEWGRYFIQIKDPASGHSTGQIVYVDWPGWAGKGKRGNLDGASMLDFVTDKEEYNVGDEINLRVPSTEGNKILVSLETGSEIIESFWVETQKESTPIKIKSTSAMAPNVYLHLTMVQPHGQVGNDLPIRLYGVKSLKVVDNKTVLHPVISMPDQLAPEQTFSIEISEADKKSMAYTIAIVDEGLLDITNYKTPDPWSKFYVKESLGVKTWDIYDDVIGAFSGKFENMLAIGGDGEIEAIEQKDANRFKPVVIFLGPFKLESGQINSHSIKIPQYVGSVKCMVVAAKNRAYGKADKVVPVNQPLMTLATLPRIVGPGEEMTLPVNVFTLDDNIKNVSVSIKTNENIKLIGQTTQNLSFPGKGDKMAYFKLKAIDALGVGKVTVVAKSGKHVANYDIELNILARNPAITLVDDKLITNETIWETSYEPIGIGGNNDAVIEVSTLPSLNLQQRLQYLIRYPHGCIEQTTSAVFAQLFLKHLVELDAKTHSSVQSNIEAGINRIKRFQLSSGGFSYWPGNNYVNIWGTNYAGHFLLEAKNLGYQVPDGLISNWIKFQKDRAESWDRMNTDFDNDIAQAYRLYTLALAGKPAMGAMNRMKEVDNISISAKWRLALSYAIAGYKKQALGIIENLSYNLPDDQARWQYNYGSRERDLAMILETLIYLDRKEDAFKLLNDLANALGAKNRWLSTQTTAYCFVGISKYSAKFKLSSETKISVRLAGNETKMNSTNFIQQFSIPNPDDKQNIEVINNGEAPVFARLIRSGTPIEGSSIEEKKNLDLTVEYIDANGKKLDVARLKQGTNFKAIVHIGNPGMKGKYTDVALTQLFPSGWEIINTRLDGSESGDQHYSYMDQRDDRVMHYFDLEPNEKKSFTVLLNASYMGTYYLPTVSAGAMYDNSVYATTPGQWTEVIEDN